VPPAVPTGCVVDASVLIKLFLPEQDSDLVTGLFSVTTPAQVLRAVPDLAYLECANILRTRVHRGLLTSAEASVLAAQLTALPLAWYPTPPLMTAILRHALTEQISAYDAAYVTLAELLRLPLITADTVLAGKLRGAAISVLDLASFR
jgi:predicted nucleic acid-binding protein